MHVITAASSVPVALLERQSDGKRGMLRVLVIQEGLVSNVVLSLLARVLARI